MFSGDPLEKSSMTRTDAAPLVSNASTSVDPMNEAPPVTSTLLDFHDQSSAITGTLSLHRDLIGTAIVSAIVSASKGLELRAIAALWVVHLEYPPSDRVP